MSVNTFLCKRYKKDTITIEDIFPVILFILGIITIGVIYARGAIFIYNDFSTTDMQFATPITFDSICVMVCCLVSVWLVFMGSLVTIFTTVSYIMDIKIASCEKD